MLPKSVTDLVTLTEAGHTFKYLYFWGHQPEHDGSIGAGCLSQWWPSPFTIGGTEFATAEHWMMWNKAVLFGDSEAASRVLQAGHPSEAKAIGREVRGFSETTWYARASQIVAEGNVAKFSQHADLKSYLLGTQQRVLVEASPSDRVWGIGLAKDDPRAQDPRRWDGLNLLGFALMDARAEISA